MLIDFPSWFLFVIVSISGLISAEIFQRISMKKKENISAEANNFIVWITISLVGLLVSILSDKFEISSLKFTHLLYFVLIGSLYFWGGKLYYSSYKGISAATGSVLVTFSAVVSTLLGVLFLNEAISMEKILGVFLVLVSIFILNYSKEFKLNKFALLALSGAAIYGVSYTVDKALVLNLNPSFYLFLFSSSIALMTLVYKPKQVLKDLVKKSKPSNFIIMIVSGLSFSLYNFFTFSAYDNGANVGVVDALNNTAVFGIIIVEYLFFNERHNSLRKITSAIIAIIAVGILVLI